MTAPKVNQHLASTLRNTNLALSAFRVAYCAINCETNECTSNIEFLDMFDLVASKRDDTSGLAHFHWQSVLDALSGADRKHLEANVIKARESGHGWSIRCKLPNSNTYFECKGFVQDVVVGEPRTIVIASRRVDDIARFEHLTNDSANGKPLSAQLCDRIDSIPSGSIVLVRLENHHEILRSLGYGTYRNVLTTLISSIRSAVRDSDLVDETTTSQDNLVLLEGSEITVILDSLLTPEALVSVRERIERVLRVPVRVDEHYVPARCAIGVASWPKDGMDADQLLNVAAFNRGREQDDGNSNSVRIEDAKEGFNLEVDLYGAIARNELALHFQPKYVLGEASKPIGAEALLRWNRQHVEWVGPDIFIPIAEETGFINDIGRWVIEEATRCQKRWIKEGAGLVQVSVNVSAKQFKQPDFLEHLMESCRRNEIPFDALELEITESCLIEDPDLVISILTEAKSQGFSIALDDFGTGFSSLSYLRTLPLDVLKIDQSFVRSLDGKSYDPSLTAAIVGIGLVLGLRIVAEGIETPEQWQMLSDWGCHQGQGFLMSKPVTCDAMSELLQKEFVVALSA